MYTFSIIDGNGKSFKKLRILLWRQKLNYEVNINMIPLDCPLIKIITYVIVVNVNLVVFWLFEFLNWLS